MAKQYKGDIGKFRRALLNAGFVRQSDGSIFNDDSKAKVKTNVRRLKLWFASDVFDATQKQQRRLEKYLRSEFGERILTMYFVENSTPYGGFGATSLCIKLQDI